MLEIQDVEKLFEVLSVQDQTFDVAFQSYSKQYEGDPFKLALTLFKLLQNKILSKTQKYIAIYIVYTLYKHKTNSPFLYNLCDICENSEDVQEQYLIYSLLVNKTDFSHKLVYHFFDEQFILPDDFKSFKLKFLEQQPRVLNHRQLHVQNIVPDFQKEQDLFPYHKLDNKDLLNHSFGLDFMRPLPEVTDLIEDPIWINPSLTVDVCWDYKMCNDNNMNTIVKELIQKAHQIQLTNQETKVLNDAFEKDSKLVYNCGVSPQTFHDLVEKNPSIAANILHKLHLSPQIQQYFDKLVNMELSLSSLELINRLANAVELPKEFLTLYISNCIVQCEENKKDKNLQNRLVRLVCVFIKSMIKNKIINPKDMFIELQAFCIEFSKISEASALFKMLKLLDQGKNDQI